MKKIGIIMTVVFSFLFTIVPSNKISALEETVMQDVVELSNIERKDSLIEFKTSDLLNVSSITYEVTYYDDEESLLYSDLVNDVIVSKIDEYTYSFYVSDEVVGVKIWKVKYLFSSGYYKNKMTTGKNSVGNLNSIYKKNYVEVTSDMLEEYNCEFCHMNDGEILNSKVYVFYFDMNIEMDMILDVSMEYSIKKVYKKNIFSRQKSEVKSYNVNFDYDNKVIDYISLDQAFYKWLSSNPNIDFETAKEKYSSLEEYYKRDVVGKNVNGNGYTWYVQPLLDLRLENTSNSLFGYEYNYTKEYLQEVAIIKISYYSQGEYFKDIPVLDEDTGWVYVKEETFWEWLSKKLDIVFDFLDTWKWVVLIFLVLIMIAVGIPIFKFVFLIFKAIFNLLKYTIFLPFTLIYKKQKENENIKKLGKKLNKKGYY